MRVLMIVTMPHGPFNAAVKAGSVGAKMQKILEAQKPESALFVEINGKRTGVFVVDLPDVSKIPALAEPWFLAFEADVQIRPAMTPQDLQRAGLDAIGQQWA